MNDLNDLIEKLEQNNLIDENGNIILEKYESGNIQAVDKEAFITLFGNSETIDHNTLIGPHTFNWNGEQITKTGEELGYKFYFDKWRELGIIS